MINKITSLKNGVIMIILLILFKSQFCFGQFDIKTSKGHFSIDKRGDKYVNFDLSIKNSYKEDFVFWTGYWLVGELLLENRYAQISDFPPMNRLFYSFDVNSIEIIRDHSKDLAFQEEFNSHSFYLLKANETMKISFKLLVNQKIAIKETYVALQLSSMILKSIKNKFKLSSCPSYLNCLSNTPIMIEAYKYEKKEERKLFLSKIILESNICKCALTREEINHIVDGIESFTYKTTITF